MTNKINFTNYSMFVGKKYDDDYYDWCVFCDDKPEKVNTIKQVEYTLHPSFPNPIRTVDDKKSRFALYSSGWGIFRIRIQILFKDNSTKDQTYHLQFFLEDNWPRKAAPESFDSPEASSVYNSLLDEKSRWRKLETISKITNLPETEVLNILNELQKDELVRKSSFKSLDSKDLWGATVKVGCAPSPV